MRLNGMLFENISLIPMMPIGKNLSNLLRKIELVEFHWIKFHWIELVKQRLRQ